jgi:hypothetical protein
VPTWLSTILIALATTVVTQYALAPRLEARKRRMLAAHEWRDQFNAGLLTIETAAARLQTIDVPDGASTTVRSAVQQERQRWLAQIDEASRYLVDHLEQYALRYIDWGGLQALAIKYAFMTRTVWISDRSQDRRVELVHRLAEPARSIFFTYWWNRFRGTPRDVHKLCDLMEELAGPQEFAWWVTRMRKIGKHEENKRAAQQARSST